MNREMAPARGRSRRRVVTLAMSIATVACGACGDGTRIVLGHGSATSAESGVGSGAFGAPVLVSELASSAFDDFKETLPADMLEIYFCSSRPGGPGKEDVWYASRASTTTAWGAPSCVVEVSSPSRETGTAVSADGLTLWFASDRPGGKGGYDIWASTRTDRVAHWSTPTPVAELNTTGDEFPRPVAESGLVMPPSYRSTSNKQYQTFITSRPAADASWTAPVPVSEVDTSTIDTDAFLSEGGLVLYFSSDRIAAGDQDLFVATRSSVGSAFTSFVPVAELNTAGYQDRDPWLSSDGREMYFSSDRSGTLKIYHATR